MSKITEHNQDEALTLVSHAESTVAAAKAAILEGRCADAALVAKAKALLADVG
jgi:hypothetical protein